MLEPEWVLEHVVQWPSQRDQTHLLEVDWDRDSLNLTEKHVPISPTTALGMGLGDKAGFPVW